MEKESKNDKVSNKKSEGGKVIEKSNSELSENRSNRNSRRREGKRDTGGDQEKKPANRTRGSKKSAIIISFILLLLIFMGAGGVLIVGDHKFYFAETNQSSANGGSIDKDYNVFIDQWNEAVVKNDLNDNYLLPRDNNLLTIDRLNKLLSVFSEPSSQVDTLSKFTQDKDSLYLPVHKYLDYVAGHRSKKQINFSHDMIEEEIVKELKKITDSRYIDNKMLLVVAFMNDFQVYFERNLDSFYRAGFTRNITKYQQYIDALNET